MVDESLQIYKFDGSGKIDFGRWKMKTLAVAAIKGGIDEAYLNDLDITAACPDRADNLKKRQLAWNYLIVALDGPPLQVVLSSATKNPFDAWNDLLAIYEPSTIEAYSQLLRELENCSMEDAYEDPASWFYWLDIINRKLGQIDATYKKSELEMIV